MRVQTTSLPLVLAIGGHDPSGGAGIQADIEAIGANGAHAVTLITCLTEQNSCNVQALHPVEPQLLSRQAELLLADSPADAIKIGLLGSLEAVDFVAALIQSHPGIPVVLDPVLTAGGGSKLAGTTLQQSMREQLLPQCDLITPNIPEAISLSGLDSDATPEDCANRLLGLGAGAVLITGTHEPTQANEITHRLYRTGVPIITSQCQRLPGEYHGSGCTLAAAVAARLASGTPMEQAVASALDFTWQSLRYAFQSGRCQATPHRLYRLDRSRQGVDE